MCEKGRWAAIESVFTSIIARLMRFYITVSRYRVRPPENPHNLIVGDGHEDERKSAREKKNSVNRKRTEKWLPFYEYKYLVNQEI